jgi:hypothetical protein
MTSRNIAYAIAASLLLAAMSAQAGALDGLKGAVSGLSGSSGASGAASALSGGSLLDHLGGGATSLASPQNVAGVLAYCQAHGYAPSASQTVKDKLMSKLGLQQPANQTAEYKQGLSGMLQDGKGGSFDLSKVKDTVAKKACGMVADHAASSLLGG